MLSLIINRNPAGIHDDEFVWFSSRSTPYFPGFAWFNDGGIKELLKSTFEGNNKREASDLEL